MHWLIRLETNWTTVTWAKWLGSRLRRMRTIQLLSFSGFKLFNFFSKLSNSSKLFNESKVWILTGPMSLSDSNWSIDHFDIQNFRCSFRFNQISKGLPVVFGLGEAPERSQQSHLIWFISNRLYWFGWLLRIPILLPNS